MRYSYLQRKVTEIETLILTDWTQDVCPEEIRQQLEILREIGDELKARNL